MLVRSMGCDLNPCSFMLYHTIQGFFFTKKVTLMIGVFPSANFPQEKYFSQSNHFSPKKPIFPTLIQSIVMRFSELTHSQPKRLAAKSAKMHGTNVLIV